MRAASRGATSSSPRRWIGSRDLAGVALDDGTLAAVVHEHRGARRAEERAHRGFVGEAADQGILRERDVEAVEEELVEGRALGVERRSERRPRLDGDGPRPPRARALDDLVEARGV